MKVTLYYFSGTGNSLFIARTIKAEMEKEEAQGRVVRIIAIQSLLDEAVIEDQSDIIGIIYPTYFLDAPEVVKGFARRLQTPKDSYLFLYANYGDILGNALHTMNRILEKNGVNGNYEVALPDNSIVYETKKEKIPDMLETAEQIIKGHAKEIMECADTKKSFYHLGGHIISLFMKPFSKKIMGFYKMKVDESVCTGCGLCEKVCPMNNIQMKETQSGSKVPAFDTRCESCFSCTHFCPQEAIRYQNMSMKKTDFQYHHPAVSVKEMIDANKK